MNKRTLISTLVLSIWLGSVSASAHAEDSSLVQNQAMSGMDMQGKDTKSMPMTMNAHKERPDLVKDKKCLDKHKSLMDKPGVKNGVKCRQAHGYKMEGEDSSIKKSPNSGTSQ